MLNENAVAVEINRMGYMTSLGILPCDDGNIALVGDNDGYFVPYRQGMENDVNMIARYEIPRDQATRNGCECLMEDAGEWVDELQEAHDEQERGLQGDEDHYWGLSVYDDWN